MAELQGALPGLRRTAAAAALAGFAVPAMGSALAWIDGMTRGRVPADFMQGLRARFGAHRFERPARPGHFHADWSGSLRSFRCWAYQGAARPPPAAGPATR